MENAKVYSLLIPSEIKALIMSFCEVVAYNACVDAIIA